MDSHGWNKTREGRIVYERIPHRGMSYPDAARILRKVLIFDVERDIDGQTLRLLEFLFRFGFLPLNLSIDVSYYRVNEPPAWFDVLKRSIYQIADSIGVPEVLTEIADRFGQALDEITSPDYSVRYSLNPSFIALIKRARDTEESLGRGFIWR